MYSSVEINNAFQIKKIYTAFRQRYDSNYYFDGEYHNFWEFVAVMDGEIGVTAGSDVLVLKKGQAILHEPMEFHRLWSEGSTCPEIVIFSFAADNMPDYFSKIFELKEVESSAKILGEMQEAFEVIGGNVKNIKDEKNLQGQLVVKKLEMFLLETVSQKLKFRQELKTKTAKNYNAIVTVLENNIDKNLSVPDIAKLCNISEINLKKTFSRYAGMGVIAYFNHLKIMTATRMIKSGMTVKETASALGFTNQNYFSTVFKRITGKAPSHCFGEPGVDKQ